MSIAAEKAALRARLLRELAALDRARVADETASVCARIEASSPWSNLVMTRDRRPEHIPTVMLYQPLSGEEGKIPEVDVMRLAACAGVNPRARVCLPVIHWPSRSMDAYELLPPSTENADAVLSDQTIVPLHEIDLIIVPGLGFDPSGARLGRGAGFYDRYLVRTAGRTPLPITIGAAFSCQVVGRVPVEAWDVPLDAIAASDRYIAVSPRA